MQHLAAYCHICTYFLKHNDKPWQAVLKQQQHIKLNSNVDSILPGIRRENIPLNTNALIAEEEGLINLNIPEHLKTSQKET